MKGRKILLRAAATVVCLASILPITGIAQVLPVDDLSIFREFYPFPPRIELEGRWRDQINHSLSFDVKNPTNGNNELAIYIPESINGTLLEINKDSQDPSSLGAPLEASVSDIASPDSTVSSLSVKSGQIGIFVLPADKETSAFVIHFRTASGNDNRIAFQAKQDVLIGTPTDIFAKVYGPSESSDNATTESTTVSGDESNVESDSTLAPLSNPFLPTNIIGRP